MDDTSLRLMLMRLLGIPDTRCGPDPNGTNFSFSAAEPTPRFADPSEEGISVPSCRLDKIPSSEGCPKGGVGLSGEVLKAVPFGLDPEQRGVLEYGDVVIEKWIITAEPGSRIPLNLYRPRNITGRTPAIVLTCGHGDSKAVPHMTYVAQTYARLGVACILADPQGEGERHRTGGIGTRAHDAPGVAYRSELAGRSVMGKFVFDAMRCLDFAETLDGVDPGRLGAAGNSLGGAVAGWLYALEPRLRVTVASGWAFSDRLCRYSKHCTRVPNHKLRAVCTWESFLALGAEHGDLLVMNGDADVVIDKAGAGEPWRDTVAHLSAVDPITKALPGMVVPGGGHRPYQGTKEALHFVCERLRTEGTGSAELDALPELNYGRWSDRQGIELERLYGTELHYRGTALPDLSLSPIPREALCVLNAGEVGTAEYTIEGWLEVVSE